MAHTVSLSVFKVNLLGKFRNKAGKKISVDTVQRVAGGRRGRASRAACRSLMIHSPGVYLLQATCGLLEPQLKDFCFLTQTLCTCFQFCCGVL